MRCRGTAADAAHEFISGIGIFGIRFVASRLADFCHGTAGSINSAKLLLVTEDAAIDGAGERERFAGARHSDVNEAAFFFDAFFFVDGAAVRADALFHTSEKDVVKFEALSAVEGDKCDAGFSFEGIGVADGNDVVRVT